MTALFPGVGTPDPSRNGSPGTPPCSPCLSSNRKHSVSEELCFTTNGRVACGLTAVDDVADLVLERLEDRVAAAGEPRDAVRAGLALAARGLRALARDGVAHARAPELTRGRGDQVVDLDV